MLVPVSRARLGNHLTLAILGNALMRIASSGSGVLAGLYLADLANRGFRVNVALVGTLGAVSFASELAAGVPMGVASDALAPRTLMATGAFLGAVATQLFGVSRQPRVFFLSRAIEGLGVASVTPSLLAHLTDATDESHSLRARVMSYFELSLLAGLALGGVVGAQFWRHLGTRALSAVASVYLASGGMLFWGPACSRGHGRTQALQGLRRALREPSLLRLAPAWICVNSIVGLWLGPTLIFLLTRHSATGQFLDGLFSEHAERVGWVLLSYSLVFATGVTGWSFVLPRITEMRALRIALLAMLAVCIGLYVLNHSAADHSALRWTTTSLTILCVMIESGFTPAALSLLAGSVGAIAGRGATMGIYSVLLSVGAILGSLLAAVLGQRFAVDGLIYGTFALALISLWSMAWLPRSQGLSGAASK